MNALMLLQLVRELFKHCLLLAVFLIITNNSFFYTIMLTITLLTTVDRMPHPSNVATAASKAYSNRNHLPSSSHA